MKLVAVVKFNDGVALVLDTPINKEYTKYGDTIIGKDGIFHASYVYGSCSDRWKAFAGRRFDLPLTDGTIEHCYGQWWDGISAKTNELIPNIISVTACSIPELKKCYVFNSHYANRDEFRALLATYTGRIYDYYEYDAMITTNKYRRNYPASKRLDKRVRKNWRRFNKKILVGESPLLTLKH